MNTLAEVLEDIRKNNAVYWDLEAEPISSELGNATLWYNARPTIVGLGGPNTAGAFKATPETLEILAGLLKDPNNKSIVFNASYDYLVLYSQGIITEEDCKASLIDPMVLAWMLNPQIPNGLKVLAKRHLNYKMATFDEVTNSSKEVRRLSKIREIISSHRKVHDVTWEAKTMKRPWPNFTSPLMTRTAISKSLREADPQLTTKMAKQLAEEKFSEEERAKYSKFIDGLEDKYAPEIKELESKVEEDFYRYAADDVRQMARLTQVLIKKLAQDQTAEIIYIEQAVRMESIRMSMRGMPFNKHALQKMYDDTEGLEEELRNKIFSIAGKEFNANSSKDTRRIIYVDLNIEPPSANNKALNRIYDGPVPPLTKGGTQLFIDWCNGDLSEEKSEGKDIQSFNYRDLSTYPSILVETGLGSGEPVLSRMGHPIGQAILDYKTVQKLRSTFMKGLLENAAMFPDGKLHAVFNSIGTKTGRFSCKEPNLQQIPSRRKTNNYDERIQSLGKAIRKFFGFFTEDGELDDTKRMVVADHSQIELRIMTDRSKDPTLNRVYSAYKELNGVRYPTADIHAETQASLSSDRTLAKNANFGFCYGMGDRRFAEQHKIFIPNTFSYDLDRAGKYRTAYMNKYKNVGKLHKLYSEASKAGQTAFLSIARRKIRVPDTGPTFGGTLVNYYCQGSGADILKYNIYILIKYGYKLVPSLKLLGQVHDEIIFSVDKNEAELGAKVVKYVMEYPWYPMSVDVYASAKFCSSWGAKDDDSIAEVGDYYAEVNGQGRIFNKDNWDDFMALDDDGQITMTATCATLSKEDMEFFSKHIPTELPKTVKKQMENKNDKASAVHN